MPSISYAITVCDEHEELKRLLEIVTRNLRMGDEVAVMVDEEKKTWEVSEVLDQFDEVKVYSYILNKDFASFKNELKSRCRGEYIFFIDADEYPGDNLIQFLPLVLETNSNVDLFYVPRSNTVEGITPEHIAKWNWRLDDKQRINWPDYQPRIIKNTARLKWVGKVHERIDGYVSISQFPHTEEDWCLYHPKTIERQERQNAFYETI